MKANPGKQIAVTGGGSGTGIAAMLNGTTDICASSRALWEKKERTLAQQKQLTPAEFVIGMDGLAVFVNPANPVDSLTLEQVKNIFQAQVTDWKDVGGNAGKIVAHSRKAIRAHTSISKNMS